ncbi:MAG TPA: hypothetical protein VFC67_23425 [Prolixibacteraceae bacterium]|nr:hypothetical protein [Prolixibacteraceae bacterium]
MSFSFRLRYFLGLIPTAQKIDAAWAERLKMREELHLIETSNELARYNELKHLIQSDEFQARKNDIINLSLIGSVENKLLTERTNLERSKPLKDYFKFIQSPDFNRFISITGSSELSRYFGLKKIVEAPDFIQRKKEAESLRYKDSTEFRKRKDFETLQKSARIKHYYDTLSSVEYRLFLELEATERGNLDDRSKRKDPKIKIYRKYLNSRVYKNVKIVEELGLPAKLEQLKQETSTKSFLEREAYLKNAARFETTPDYAPLKEFKQLSKSSEMIFYLKCSKSSLYANYQKIVDSKELARLIELRSEVENPEFKQRVAFLKNKNRFNTTPARTTEKEFYKLENSKTIKNYFQLQKRPELAFFNQWEVVMEENFAVHQLSTTLWEPENYWGSKMAGFSFSQSNELQAYHGLKNIVIRNNVLSIVTKAEKSEGKVWDPAIGLLTKKFDFSSGILNTGNSFRFKEGVIEAKVKFRANKAFTSAFSLTGNQPFPQIDVFRSGNNCVGLGIIDQPGIKGVKQLAQIKGLNYNNFHIFRVEISGNLVVWKINNYEVHREHVSRNLGELFINFIGSLHQPVNGESLPHHFEIDWVRCLKKK